MTKVRSGRRHRPILACGQCRKRKVKCDGIKPSCGNCTKLGSMCSFPQTGRVAHKLANIEDRTAWMMQNSISVVEEWKWEEPESEEAVEPVETESPPLTLHYEMCRLLAEMSLLSQPKILGLWTRRYYKAQSKYMERVEQLYLSNARLCLEQETAACRAWTGICEYVPAFAIAMPFPVAQELQTPSIPREVRDLFVAAVVVFSVNVGIEPDSSQFGLALSQAQLAADDCRNVDLTPLHFLTFVFLVAASSISGFLPYLRRLTEQAKEIGMRMGLHRSEILARMNPKIAERLATAWWILYSYDTNISILLGQSPWSLKEVTTPELKYATGVLGAFSFTVRLLKLYQPVWAVVKASYRNTEVDNSNEVRALDAQLENWSNSLPDNLSQFVFGVNQFPLLRMHLVYCILKCLLWSKQAFVDQCPSASRICEQVARRLIVLCYDNMYFAKKNGLVPFHADFAYSIIFLNGLLFPHKRWVYMDIRLMERTMDRIAEYAFPLMANELKKSWKLRLELMKRSLRGT